MKSEQAVLPNPCLEEGEEEEGALMCVDNKYDYIIYTPSMVVCCSIHFV
jgi:hypothetical protein